MKDLKKLIDYYNKRVEMYTHLADQNSIKGEENTGVFNLGIAEGFKKAAEELEKVNKLIDEQITKLL